VTQTASNETIIYQEEQSNLPLMITIYVVMLVLGVSGLIVAKAGAKEGWPIIMVVAVIFPFVIWGFSRMRVVVTPFELRFGFPAIHRRLPLSKVRVGEIAELKWWYGIGVHFLFTRWVFNTRLGRSVEVFGNGTRYIIGSRDPEKLKFYISSALTQRPQ
jgi:hypothetical protein